MKAGVPPMHLKVSIRYIAAALLFVTVADGLAQYAQALPPCTDTAISNSNGSIIRLRTGQSYKIYPGTGARTASWLPGDKVSACPLGGSAYQITNLRNNQAVKTLKN
jgi:hypothetical protein